MSESGAKGMGESKDPFTAEELYELRREDLNEFQYILRKDDWIVNLR